ncbi:unnamed protein product, partial [Brenthis ino]
MEDVENELKDLREKNNELVQKVQYWKMTAAQRENEKLDLMKEINDLRLKISRLRSGGAANALKLDAALQSASEEALSHLVQASSAVARTLELAKTYVQERQELDTALPRWSTLSSTPSSEKINIVPPMLIGGRLIQPVVSLSRTLQSNISRSVSRSPNEQNHSVPERAVPLHMLQDVYIPLTRIDAGERSVNNADTDMEVNHADNSTEDLALDDSAERMMEESQNITESEDFEESRRLDVVSEEIEPEDGLTPERSRTENPLEGPSWLLDRPSSKKKIKSSTNLEPDSTTEFEDTLNAEPGPSHSVRLSEEPRVAGAEPAPALACEFTPTVRRRRRTSPPATPRAAASPHYSPRPARRYSNNGRILKVLVAKMRLDDDVTNVSPPKRSKEETPPKLQRNNPNNPDARKQTRDGSPKYQVRDISPSKRLMRFDAPSPNGSTDSRVIVLEAKNDQPEPGSSGVSQAKTLNRINSTDGHNNRISNNNHDHNNQEESNNSQTDRNRNQSSDNNRSRDNHKRDSHNHDNRKRDSRNRDGHGNNSVDGNSRDSRDSDSSGSEMVSEGRTRRPRKAIVYKEKPLNRKLRR